MEANLTTQLVALEMAPSPVVTPTFYQEGFAQQCRTDSSEANGEPQEAVTWVP